jgi:hypothetical protein
VAAESVAVTVNDDVPPETVPEIRPEDEFSDIPEGKLPLVTDQVTGVTPPVEARMK